jgi:hypothetical protein
LERSCRICDADRSRPRCQNLAKYCAVDPCLPPELRDLPLRKATSLQVYADFCRKMSFDAFSWPVDTVCSMERMGFILQQTGPDLDSPDRRRVTNLSDLGDCGLFPALLLAAPRTATMCGREQIELKAFNSRIAAGKRICFGHPCRFRYQ